MKFTSLATASAALLAVAFSAAPALAQPAEATASVNVRTGPGTQYRVVDTLRPGEQVRIDRCANNGWCLVEKSGPDGWVSRNYLSEIRGGVVRPDRAPTRATPNLSFSFSFGRGNGFSIGTPPRGGMADLVCLVTFRTPAQVSAGRDRDVVRAQVMPRRQAERLDRPRDNRAIYTYGTNRQTTETCRYLNNLNR